MDQLPIFTSLRGYKTAWFTRDTVAGLTLWAVLVPEALAYATIAGVSPVIGLYAVPPALLLYAAFGSSKHLVIGPGAATAALSAAAVADLTTGGPDNFLAFTAMLALATGVLALAAGLLRLGFVANLIAEPVMKGFIIGLALTIIVGQLPKIFGFEKEEGDFFQQAWGLPSPSRRHAVANAHSWRPFVCDRRGVAAVRAERSRIARRGRVRHRGRALVRPLPAWRRDRGPHRERAPFDRVPERAGRE